MEIKLRLPSKEAHDEVAKQLKDSFRETHQQENFFFDGVDGELSSQRVVLRCRFYNHDKRAIVTLKVLAHGRCHSWGRLSSIHCWADRLGRPASPHGHHQSDVVGTGSLGLFQILLPAPIL